MSELNPCPICGCSVRVWAKRFDEEDVEYIIECDNDFCGLTYGISCGYNRDEIKKAWNSVTALSPTVSEDCVSRQSVLDLLGDWVYECEYDEVAELVEKLPPVTPTERAGEWVKATGVAPPEFAGRYVCSNCGNYALMDMPYGSRQELSHFCPNCGAKMKGDKK